MLAVSNLLLYGLFTVFIFDGSPLKFGERRQNIAIEMQYSLENELLNQWYPRSIDQEFGGFLTNYSFDFKAADAPDKTILSQAEHICVNASAALRFPLLTYYKIGAQQGLLYLKTMFWDKEFGGFYSWASRQGLVKDSTKTVIGQAAGMQALSLYFKSSHDSTALSFAKKAFFWLEKYGHDPIHKGYYSLLQKNGIALRPFPGLNSNNPAYKSAETHLLILEAFTELFEIWRDDLLKQRIEELMDLMREVFVAKKGYLVLYFEEDWKPVSYKDTNKTTILKNINFDHVSFGLDLRAASALLTSAQVLPAKKEAMMLRVAKKLVDHSLDKGWDSSRGGFHEQGYYFKGEESITIMKESKNWKTQALGLETLLVTADLYPNDRQQYYPKFEKLWNYIQTYLIDHNNSDWYEEGLDKDPQRRNGPKGHLLKTPYFQFNALINCIDQLQKKHG